MQPRGSIILSQKARHWRHSPVFSRMAGMCGSLGTAGSGGQCVGAEDMVELGPQAVRGAHPVPVAEPQLLRPALAAAYREQDIGLAPVVDEDLLELVDEPRP